VEGEEVYVWTLRSLIAERTVPVKHLQFRGCVITRPPALLRCFLSTSSLDHCVWVDTPDANQVLLYGSAGRSEQGTIRVSKIALFRLRCRFQGFGFYGEPCGGIANMKAPNAHRSSRWGEASELMTAALGDDLNLGPESQAAYSPPPRR